MAQEGQVAEDRKEVLLKEYDVCQQEAMATANWLWTSTSIFLAIWMTGLGIVATKTEDVPKEEQWLLAAGAAVAQVLWMAFAARSFRIRQLLFVRQRQIETHLGMFKSRAIHVADMNQSRRQVYLQQLPGSERVELGDFLKAEAELETSVGEKWLINPAQEWLQPVFGRGGHIALCGFSALVAIAWILLAGLA